MLIIGCDFHTRYQQIAMLDEQTGELIERRLEHPSGEAHEFYRDLAGGPGFEVSGAPSSLCEGGDSSFISRPLILARAATPNFAVGHK